MFKKMLLSIALVFVFTTLVFAKTLSLNEIMEGVCRVNNGGSGTCIKETDKEYLVLTNAHVVGTRDWASVEFFSMGYKTKELLGNVIWKQRVERTDVDFAIISVSKNYFTNTPKTLMPRVIPLVPKGYVPKEGDYISAAGCPGGRWIQGWEGRILLDKKTRLIFTPPPIGGQSGSGLTIHLNGETRVGAVLTWRVGDRDAPEKNAVGAAIPIARLYSALDGEVSTPSRIPSHWQEIKYVSRGSDGVFRDVIIDPTRFNRPIINVPNGVTSDRTYWIDKETNSMTDVVYDPVVRWFVPRPNPQPRPNPTPGPNPGGQNPYGNNVPDISPPLPQPPKVEVPVPEVETPELEGKTPTEINLVLAKLKVEQESLKKQIALAEKAKVDAEKAVVEAEKAEAKAEEAKKEAEKANGGPFAFIARWVESNPVKSGFGMAVLFAIAWFLWNRVIRKRLIPVIDTGQDFIENLVKKNFGEDAAKDVREYLEDFEAGLLALVDQVLREKREQTRIFGGNRKSLKDRILVGNEEPEPPVKPGAVAAAAAVVEAEAVKNGQPVPQSEIGSKIQEAINKGK